MIILFGSCVNRTHVVLFHFHWFCSNGGEDPYAFIQQTDQENLFPEFGLNLQPEQDHHHVRTVGGDQFDSFTGDSNGLGGPFGGLVYSIGSSAQLDLGTHSFRGTASTHVQQEQEQEQACCPVVEINSSSSVELVKEEFDEECSRKRSTFFTLIVISLFGYL